MRLPAAFLEVSDNGVLREQQSGVYPRGTALFHQGQLLSEVFYIVSGTVKLTRVDGDGRESLVGLAMASEWLGTAAVIAQQPAPTNAVTCSRAVLSRAPAATFRRLLQEDQQLSLLIHRAHAHALCSQATRIGQLCSNNSRRRLQSVLCRFATAAPEASNGAAVRLQLPLAQWELAEFIGVTPEYFSRLLRDMERDGLLCREQGGIVIRDMKRLAEGSDPLTAGATTAV